MSPNFSFAMISINNYTFVNEYIVNDKVSRKKIVCFYLGVIALFFLIFKNGLKNLREMVTSFPVSFAARFFAYDRSVLFRMINQEGKNTPSNPIVAETRGQKDVLFSPSFCLEGIKKCSPMTIIRPIIMATLGNPGAMKPYVFEN